MNRRTTAALLVAAAVLTNVAFTALGAVFNYPDVLGRPAGDILAAFREHQGAVSAWFTVLALSAAATDPDPAVAAVAQERFQTAHDLLGHLVGETVGYLLTAVWTLLVLAALHRTLAGPWFTGLGGLSAVLVLAGVLSPLDLPGVDLANFVGYVLWSVWLVAFALVLLRRSGDRVAPLTVAGARR